MAIGTIGLGLVAGTIVGVTPAQAYGPTAVSFGCRLYFAPGAGQSPSTWNDTITLTQSPASPATGDTVTVTLTATDGPYNGPLPLTPGMVPVVVKVALGGSQSGTIDLNQATYPAAPVEANPTGQQIYKLGGFSATGTYVAGATGPASLTVSQIGFNNSSAATWCSAPGDRDHKNAPLATSVVENYTVYNPALSISSISGQTVITHARANNVITFAVSGMAANATLSASLHNGSGGGTAEGSGTGTTDASGAGTGTLTVPGGATVGSRTVVVSDGANSKSVGIIILGSPTVGINPGGGGAGTSVHVTGTNFNPNSTVAVRGYQVSSGFGPPPATADPAVTVTANGSGEIDATFVVNASNTAYIGAVSGQLFNFAPWANSPDSCIAKNGSAATGSCGLSYNLSQTITGGNLGMVRGSGASNIAFSAITLNGTVQTSTASLGAITVKDYRGGTFGWSLTGTVSDFTGTPAGTIPKANLAWTPSCVDTAGAVNAVAAVAGSAGPVDGGTLCSAPANAAGTGGSFDAAAGLSLTVPATQLAGTYAATLVITLS